MANRKKKPRSIKKKKSYRLTDTDLALAATAPANRRKAIIKAAAGSGGYDRYRGVKTNLGGILNLALNSRVPASLATKKQIKTAVARACIGSREVKGNQSVAEGLYDYVVEHNVTAAMFDFPPVSSGLLACGVFGLRIFSRSMVKNTSHISIFGRDQGA
jgi:hypothetical protein